MNSKTLVFFAYFAALREQPPFLGLKEVTEKIQIYEAQLLTYLKAMNKRVGLLVNFNEVKLKDGIKRMII